MSQYIILQIVEGVRDTKVIPNVEPLFFYYIWIQFDVMICNYTSFMLICLWLLSYGI